MGIQTATLQATLQARIGANLRKHTYNIHMYYVYHASFSQLHLNATHNVTDLTPFSIFFLQVLTQPIPAKPSSKNFKHSIKIWSLHTLYKFGHYGLKIYG